MLGRLAAVYWQHGSSIGVLFVQRAILYVITLCRLAVGAQDRQSVGYSTLRSSKQGAARLGAVAASSCAAGIAIDTKQFVHVRDLVNG
jgi:hypothetical protein